MATDEVVQSEEKQKLSLEIKVEEKSACERHVTVLISREDVDRYFEEQFNELMPKAEVPGFRAGRAPRKIVESKFRPQITEQVKGSILLDCMNQINETEEFSAISEPDFDFDAVEIPEEGPMTFEFDIEVRPEFDLPKWKGLTIERPVREITQEDVDGHLVKVLSDYADLAPVERPVEAGDYVTVNVSVKSDDKTVATHEEMELCVRPTLSFPDGMVEEFDKLMVGGKAEETKTTTAKISADSENAELRDKEVEVSFEILDVKAEELPTLDKQMLSKLGDFEDEGDVKDAIKSELERQLEYRQGQQVREQITASLTESASWELPQDLLRRQSSREFSRAVLELRRSGFDEDSIRAYQNELQQNAMKRTETALKEHFILESIAEAENVEESAEDFDQEIALIAAQMGDSPRRVRARLEKRGEMDGLRNQIIERKVIELIKSEAKFKDVPFEFDERKVEPVDEFLVGGSSAAIPEAKHDDSNIEQPKLPTDNS